MEEPEPEPVVGQVDVDRARGLLEARGETETEESFLAALVEQGSSFGDRLLEARERHSIGA